MKLFSLAAAILLCGSATAAAADILVVRSAGPSAKGFPPGKSIPETTKITLKQNDSIVLLDGRGTRTLRGPGTFAAGGSTGASAPRSGIAALAGGTPSRRARIGAVRSVAAAPRSPSIWHVDVAKSSTICLADPSNVTLWRAEASQPVTLTLTASDGSSENVEWAKGEPTLVWPSDVKISEGATYRLTWPGAASPTSLSFKWLSAKPAGLEDMASSLIQNGCEAQLDLLIETVKLPEESATAG